VIGTPLFTFFEEEFTSHLRGDFALVILGSAVSAIGFGGVAVYVFGRRSRGKVFNFGSACLPVLTEFAF